MKKLFDEEEEWQDTDKRKILAAIMPFVLILIVLGATLLVNSIKKNKEKPEDLQQSIMTYADEHGEMAGIKIPEKEKVSAVIKDSDLKGSGEKTEKAAGQERDLTPSPSVSSNTAVMEKGDTDYSKVKFDTDRQLGEMMFYWEQNNQKALDDLANLERYIAMSWTLMGTDDFYYQGETNSSGKPEGKGIAVYADNQYYYGEWKNGMRNGAGTWIHYHIHPVENKTDLYTYHQYAGRWAEDLPYGEGAEHYEYNTELLKAGIGYNTNLIGSYRKGLVHGEFYLTNIYADGNSKEWNAEAENGSWIYINENRDNKGRGPVYVDTHDPNNYIWMGPKENKNIGVSCLISKNKN